MLLLEPIKRRDKKPNKAGFAIVTFVVCAFATILILVFVELERNPRTILTLVFFPLMCIISFITFIREYKKTTTEKHIETPKEYYERKYGKEEL